MEGASGSLYQIKRGQAQMGGYDQYLRRNSLLLAYQGSTLQNVTYGYDTASRLQTVGDGTVSALYDYIANSPLVNHITFKNGATACMTTTKQYDHLDRLTSISSAGASTVSFGYGYNQANQRTGTTLADRSY